MQATTRTLTEATIYWDAADPQDEGWAFRVRYDDGREESGRAEDVQIGNLPDSASPDQLDRAVVSLAYQHGEEIDTGEVAYSSADGGSATWLRD